jgi:hypothetical protein
LELALPSDEESELASRLDEALELELPSDEELELASPLDEALVWA